MTCPGPGPRSRVTALLSLILVSPLLLHLLSGHFHYTYPIPEVPEGGWTRHHQRGDHQGCRGAGRDRPCRDGAAQRPDPLVPGPEPYPDSGMVMVACPGPGGGIPSIFIARCREGSSSWWPVPLPFLRPFHWWVAQAPLLQDRQWQRWQFGLLWEETDCGEPRTQDPSFQHSPLALGLSEGHLPPFTGRQASRLQSLGRSRPNLRWEMFTVFPDPAEERVQTVSLYHHPQQTFAVHPQAAVKGM